MRNKFLLLLEKRKKMRVFWKSAFMKERQMEQIPKPDKNIFMSKDFRIEKAQQI